MATAASRSSVGLAATAALKSSRDEGPGVAAAVTVSSGHQRVGGRDVEGEVAHLLEGQVVVGREVVLDDLCAVGRARSSCGLLKALRYQTATCCSSRRTSPVPCSRRGPADGVRRSTPACRRRTAGSAGRRPPPGPGPSPTSSRRCCRRGRRSSGVLADAGHLDPGVVLRDALGAGRACSMISIACASCFQWAYAQETMICRRVGRDRRARVRRSARAKLRHIGTVIGSAGDTLIVSIRWRKTACGGSR